MADEEHAQGVPHALLVPVGRTRPLQLHRAARDRRLSHAVLSGLTGPRRLHRQLRAAPRGPGDSSVQLGDGDLLRREGWAAHPPDAPLGGVDLRRRDRVAHGPDLLHRRIPQTARDQLGHRHDPARPRAGGGLHRLLPSRRSAVGHRAAHHRRHHPRPAARRRAPVVSRLRWRVARHRHHRPALSGAHPDHPRPDHRAAVRPPRARLAPEAHAVSPGRGARRAT